MAKKKSKKPAVIDVTWDQVKELFPEPAKAWQEQGEDGDEPATPPEQCKFWLELDDEFGDLLPSHPGYSLCAKDPADDGFTNVTLIWDGEMWG